MDSIALHLSKYEDLKEKGIFLRDYTTTMYMNGATTIRIEKNLERIAATWNTTADFSVLPTCIILSLWSKECEIVYNISGNISTEKLNFQTITELSRLSWDIHDRGLDVQRARCGFNEIIHKKRYSLWLVTLLVGCANASFCELFGGDIAAIVTVFIATVDGFYIKQRLTEAGLDYRLSIIISACIAAIISCAPFAFHLGATPDIALATSVLFLVPGIPLANAVNDFIYGHYICCLNRFFQALVITISLSLGLILAFIILKLHFI